MRIVIGLLHALHGNMRVNLGRRQVRVTQQRLNASQIGTVIEKMRRKAMAKLVGADAKLNRRLR